MDNKTDILMREIQRLREQHDLIQMKLMDAIRVLDNEKERNICTALSECEIEELKEKLVATILTCAELELQYLKEVKPSSDEFYMEK